MHKKLFLLILSTALHLDTHCMFRKTMASFMQTPEQRFADVKKLLKKSGFVFWGQGCHHQAHEVIEQEKNEFVFKKGFASEQEETIYIKKNFSQIFYTSNISQKLPPAIQSDGSCHHIIGFQRTYSKTEIWYLNSKDTLMAILKKITKQE